MTVAQTMAATAMATLIALPVASSSLADECVRPPANRTVLFYNRVPKAGSESVIQAMRTRMDGVLRRDGHGTRCGRVCDISSTQQRVRTEAFMVESEARCRAKRLAACPRAVAERAERPIAVEGHVFYFDWPERLAEERPLWVNVLRDPIARCQSRYDYDREIARGRAVAPAWPPTLDACVASGACAFGAGRRRLRVARSDAAVNGSRWAQMLVECGSNYQTRWLCGMSPECLALRFDDPRLLIIAKARVGQGGRAGVGRGGGGHFLTAPRRARARSGARRRARGRRSGRSARRVTPPLPRAPPRVVRPLRELLQQVPQERRRRAVGAQACRALAREPRRAAPAQRARP